jgi:hypothetical protein
MKQFFFLLALCGIFSFSACKKNATPNRPSFTWTYLGTSFTADSSEASGPNNIVSYSEISGWMGSIVSPTNGFNIKLTSLAVGSYPSGGANGIVSASSSDDVYPSVVNITANVNKTVSGNFSGTYDGQPISGLFANVPIVH